MLSAIRRAIEARLKARLVAESLSEPDALAGHVMAVIQGLSTLARDGADRAELLAVAKTAMGAWPVAV